MKKKGNEKNNGNISPGGVEGLYDHVGSITFNNFGLFLFLSLVAAGAVSRWFAFWAPCARQRRAAGREAQHLPPPPEAHLQIL